MPHFRLLKRQRGNKLKTLGQWNGSRRTIAMAPRYILLKKEKEFNATFLHEMCHQAVGEIDKLPFHRHGPVWVKWMRKVGLPPVSCKSVDLLTEKERVVAETKKQNRAEAEAKEKRVSYPRVGQLAKWFEADKKIWHIGMIAAPNDKQGKYWAFAEKYFNGRWTCVPWVWLKELNQDDLRGIDEKVLSENAEQIRQMMQKNKEIRKKNREIKNRLRGIYGF
jgi:predicted SprT family Zn-dependent metalloprotease